MKPGYKTSELYFGGTCAVGMLGLVLQVESVWFRALCVICATFISCWYHSRRNELKIAENDGRVETDSRPQAGNV